jgi:predicted N-formylglutamate amidohydrolase
MPSSPHSATFFDLPPLLSPDDPAPVLAENSDGGGPAVVVCDHGGRAVPRRLAGLGLEPRHFDRHIAWDIGALEVARRLSRRFDAPLVSQAYSRLVIDANRGTDDATLIAEVSDDVVIPANHNLSAAAAAQRVREIFDPYHAAVAAALDGRRENGVAAPALISVHSFTPVMRGFQRPWEIGVLWDGDPRIAVPLLTALRMRGDVAVGDNQPYSGRGNLGGTVEFHALPAGLPNVLLEVRQDLVADAAGAARWAAILGDALAPILADPDLRRPKVYPRLAP